jgi:hypothetical protein
MKKSKPCTGDIVVIDGKKWCVGEKIISKWKHSKRNKTRTPRKKTRGKTAKNSR